ncbi:hypothetical protein LIPSTDRAFT_76491 [Lipomyces starkeyi NRRL Y-11557]|uniref:Uncharacterized protein n=1 Tax=Lipomyces starkeyi NRRL Y-11557 TaxID=675824 RepID=A0A1E3PUQ0_LIPST|nr:hypothetical protein LIPSTDRAFT_76491 [Lipomyces starkeyi NRRL Y-11557]
MNSSPESTRPTTRLSTSGAMPIARSTDILPRTDDDPSSNYDKALYLLKNNPPEQRLDIRLPHSQYLKLEESWSKFKSENNIPEERRYPSLSYNSLMQIATVVTIQSALHDYTSTVLREIIASSVNEYLSIHKPTAIRRIVNVGSSVRRELSPYDMSMSSKEPDEAFGYANDDDERPSLQLIIECGLSEDYKALCRDKDLWIQRLGAKVVVLLCLDEAPRFRNPRTAFQKVEDAVAEVARMDKHADKAMARNLQQGIYGPIEYCDHTWIGKVDKLFIEVWRADEKQPVRKWLIKDGHSYNPLPKTVGLKVSDVFPENEWTALKISDSNVRFRRYFLKRVVAAMKLTARSRFISFLDSSGVKRKATSPQKFIGAFVPS